MTRLGKIVTVADGDATDVYGNVEPTEGDHGALRAAAAASRQAGDPDNWQIGAWSLYLPSGPPSLAGIASSTTRTTSTNWSGRRSASGTCGLSVVLPRAGHGAEVT